MLARDETLAGRCLAFAAVQVVMTTKSTFRTNVRIGVDAAPSRRSDSDADDRPFEVIVFADRASEEHRRLLRIDGDTCDGVLARLVPGWRGPLGAGSADAVLQFASLDDFHPDRIVGAIPALAALLAAREDPERAKMLGIGSPPPAHPRAASDAPAAGEGARADTLSLDDLIQMTEAARQRPPATSELQPLIERLVAPHLVQVDPNRDLVRDAIDRTLTTHVRHVLRDPAFRRAEAFWRSMRSVVAAAAQSGVPTHIWIVPCTKAELSQALAGDPEQAPLLAPLVTTVEPGLLVGDWQFDHARDDVALLQRIGALAKRTGAAFLAAASPRLFGCQSFRELAALGPSALQARTAGETHEAWRALRDTEAAQWVGLAAPRLLARAPYGRRGVAGTAFPFEELAADDDPVDQLLWANPVFAIAAALLRAFGERGWALDPRRDVRVIEGLPFYVHHRDGEAIAVPCGEVLLTDRQIEVLADEGLLPVWSQRDQAAVVLPQVRSIGAQRAALPIGEAVER